MIYRDKTLNNLHDDIIGDIISVKIDTDMSVSTLHALETVYSLRLQLAQLSGESNEPVYESLCRDRYEQIAKALTKKYAEAVTVNEKIEILERLEAIWISLNAGHSGFALLEAGKIEELPILTYSQKLRLSWMFGLEFADQEDNISTMLSQVKDAFDLATLSDIEMFGTEEQRRRIMLLYAKMFGTALQTDNIAELGRILVIGANWNIYPQLREMLTALAEKTTDLAGLSLPEKRVNAIAAEIYSRLDVLTGKYADFDNLIA